MVGLGGVGSHVVQQLALLGVGSLVLVDPQAIEESNLNRLVGASVSDIGRRKVDIAVRLIESVDPAVEILPVGEELRNANAFDAVKAAAIVFGCVDHDGPRLVLTELCAAYAKPYFDLATEIVAAETVAFGGRVVFSHGGDGCLSCLDELSRDEVRQYFEDEASRLERSRLYGVPVADLDETGPSVVSLNGVVASLAVTEFMAFVTGLRRPERLLRYHGHQGKVTVGVDPPAPDCYYCKSIYGLKEEAGVERYRKGT